MGRKMDGFLIYALSRRTACTVQYDFLHPLPLAAPPRPAPPGRSTRMQRLMCTFTVHSLCTDLVKPSALSLKPRPCYTVVRIYVHYYVHYYVQYIYSTSSTTTTPTSTYSGTKRSLDRSSTACTPYTCHHQHHRCRAPNSGLNHLRPESIPDLDARSRRVGSIGESHPKMTSPTISSPSQRRASDTPRAGHVDCRCYSTAQHSTVRTTS